ncbi:hypothetical protein [Maridesulfovibrio sp. FT414]|uniref:hypothetical protein n=1 Tax=Maridesulfovibrio sp. FT414 TaxID=2979469 RepID=UPI003D8053DA
MKFVCGVGELGFPALFAGARRRIILHAAVYGPFAESEPHRSGLEEALARSSFGRLDVLALLPGGNEPWRIPFLEVLRSGIPRQDVEAEIVRSAEFLMDLSRRYPGKVRVHFTSVLPCFPVVIVDDEICFGQYSHASVPAPGGFWGRVSADVERLLGWAEEGRIPAQAQAEAAAAYRLVSECVVAMKSGIPPKDI